MRTDFVRFPKFCEANIFDFQSNVFYRQTELPISWKNITLATNMLLIYKSSIKTISNWRARPSNLTSSITKISHFSQVSCNKHLIHFSHYPMSAHKHEFKYSCCMYILCILYAFKSYQPSYWFCNVLKKVQLCNFNNTKKYKIQKILLIDLKIWKLRKQLSNQSISFKKDKHFFHLLKFKWFCARNHFQ